MPSTRAERMIRDALLLSLAALGTLYYVTLPGVYGWPLDDAWIHQVYARNLAQRGEWAFIPGSPSAASTAPLYTVLLSLSYRLGLDPYAWAQALGAAALGLAALTAARLGERLHNRVAGWAAGLSVVLSWHLLWAAVSGMETMLFSALTLVLIAVSWQAADSPRRVWTGLGFGVVGGLLTLTRPEGVLLVGLSGLGVLAYFAPDRGSWGGFGRWLAAAVAAYLLLLSPYLLLNLSLTGGLLPDTAAAKWAQFAPLLARPYSQRLLDLALAVLTGAQVLLLLGVVPYLLRLRTDRRRALLRGGLLLWPLALLMLYAARLPASYQHGRYVIPLLPALLTAGAVGVVILLQRGPTAQPDPAAQPDLAARLWWVFTRFVTGVIAATTLVFALWVGAEAFRLDLRIIHEEMVTTAVWIERNLPPETRLAAHDIGALGYLRYADGQTQAERPFFDTAGLLDPEVAALYHDAAGLWARLDAWNAAYIVGFPDQLPGRTTPDDPRLCQRVYISQGRASRSIGGPSMAVYALTGCE